CCFCFRLFWAAPPNITAPSYQTSSELILPRLSLLTLPAPGTFSSLFFGLPPAFSRVGSFCFLWSPVASREVNTGLPMLFWSRWLLWFSEASSASLSGSTDGCVRHGNGSAVRALNTWTWVVSGRYCSPSASFFGLPLSFEDYVANSGLSIWVTCRGYSSSQPFRFPCSMESDYWPILLHILRALTFGDSGWYIYRSKIFWSYSRQSWLLTSLCCSE